MNSKVCSYYLHHQQQLATWLKAILRVSRVWIKNLKFKRSCPEDRIQLDQAPDELFYKTFVMRFFFFYLFFFCFVFYISVRFLVCLLFSFFSFHLTLFFLVHLLLVLLSAMCNRPSCAQRYQLPQIHCWKGILFT